MNRSMGIKLIASSVALVLLTIMAGAITVPTQRNRNWNMETIHLILNSQNVDGGFGLLTDQRPVSLYDTYYNLLLLRALRKRIPMRKRMISALANLQKQPVHLTSSSSLLNLWYQIGSDRLIGVPFHSAFRSKIEKALNSLPTSHGLVVDTQAKELPVFSDLLMTQAYATISRDLSLPVRLNIDQSWLLGILSHPMYQNDPYLPSAYASFAAIEPDSKGPMNTMLHQVVAQQHVTNTFSKSLGSVPQVLIAISWATLLRDESIPFRKTTAFTRSLEHLATETGGYNIFSNVVMDPQITYQLRTLFNLQSGMRKVPQDIIRSQLPGGLFGWNDPAPSDPMDSYWALRIVQALNDPLPISLRRYFEEYKLPIDTQGAITDALYLDDARKSLKLSLAPQTLARVTGLTNKLIRLRIFSLSSATYQIARKDLKSSVALLAMPNHLALQNIFLILRSVNALHYPLPTTLKMRVVSFIQGLQKPDGGYGPPMLNTGDLQDTYYCVATLRDLGAKPRNTKGLLLFLRTHQNRYGGYAASGAGSPSDLSNTFYGVETQLMLSHNNKGAR